ncbi:MAG: hypothetical protein LBV12_04750, partial [Puniceicoccales bacterium]|nr:hypothetical protein [Puniceicoccales bacterium]
MLPHWNKPSTLWLTFGFCLTLVFGALIFVSVIIFRLEASEQKALKEKQAAEISEKTREQYWLRDQKVRLAIWQTDAELFKWVATENNHPYF